MKIKFSGKGIAFLSHYMATNDIRYYLNGIKLQRLTAEQGGGVLGAATNGHALGLWHDREGEIDRDIIVSLTKPLITALGKTTRGIARKLVTLDNRLACVDAQGIEEFYIQSNGIPTTTRLPFEVEGKFPDVLRVMKSAKGFKDAGGPVNVIDSRYLALLDKSIPKESKHFNGILLRQPEKDGSIYAIFPAVREAVAVVMPMRNDPDDIPSWLTRLFRSQDLKDAALGTPLPAKQPSDAAPPPDFKRVRTTGSYPA